MHTIVFRYSFAADVEMSDVENALLLSLWGVQSLHGEAQTRLDAVHLLDADHQICVVDASTDVGRDLNRLFIGYLERELGGNAFEVQRVNPTEPLTPSLTTRTNPT